MVRSKGQEFLQDSGHQLVAAVGGLLSLCGCKNIVDKDPTVLFRFFRWVLRALGVKERGDLFKDPEKVVVGVLVDLAAFAEPSRLAELLGFGEETFLLLAPELVFC